MSLPETVSPRGVRIGVSSPRETLDSMALVR